MNPGPPAAPADPDLSPSPGAGAAGARAPHLRRWLVAVLAVVGVLALLRALVIAPYVIPSDSMEPTLTTSDRILVDKVDPSHVERGDIVVFQGPTFGGDTAYVKRVIGVGGDEVSCCTADGHLQLNGAPLDEPYVAPGDAPSTLRFDVRVPPERLWVMGDHRSDSGDSRAHLGDPGGGMVPVGDVIGRAVWRYWPLSDLGRVPDQPATAGAVAAPRSLPQERR